MKSRRRSGHRFIYRNPELLAATVDKRLPAAAVETLERRQLLSSISGAVFLDANMDGVYDPDEAGIPDVVIRLTNSQGVVAEISTDWDGSYRFENLAPGTYGLIEIQPADYLDGYEMVGTAGGMIMGDDRIGSIRLLAGMDATGYTFGEIGASSLSGYVYVDVNRNGLRDPEEPGIEGVLITLSGSDDLSEVWQTTTTDAQGQYTFYRLRPGIYRIAETQPAALGDGQESVGTQGGRLEPDAISDIMLYAGVEGLENNFGELVLSSLSGFVFVDSNGNGVRDVGEAAIAGVLITLTGQTEQGQVLLTTLTDANGYYAFRGLQPGLYTLAETQPAGYDDGPDSIGTQGGYAGNDVLSDIVLTGADGLENNFAELIPPPPPDQQQQFFAVSGRVLKDLTGDGLSADDQGLSGVRVRLFLDRNDNGKLDEGDGEALATVFTEATGAYVFRDLEAGRYFVKQQPLARHVLTAPVLGRYYTVELGESDVANLDFANFEKPHRADVCAVRFLINGKQWVNNLRNKVHSGDWIQVSFTVRAGSSVTLSLVSYTAPGPKFIAAEAAQQQVYESQTATFGPGSYNLAMGVRVPDGYFQVDFVIGHVITQFGPEGSNIFYSPQGRLISADNGGTAPAKERGSDASGGAGVGRSKKADHGPAW